MNEKKAVIWDSVNVLTYVVGESFAHLWAKRLEVSVEEVNRVLSMPGPDGRSWNRGEISQEEYFNYFIKEIGLPIEKKTDLTLSIEDVYYDKKLLKYIQSLKSQYITALLTVIPREFHDLIRDNWPEFERSFDHVITSFEVHLTKPNPKIFELTLEIIGCKAENVVFIDDTKENVLTAEEMGIRSVLFKTRDQAIKDLEVILLE